MDAPLLAAVDALCTDLTLFASAAAITEPTQFEDVLSAVPSRVPFAELIRGMGSYLTNGDGEVRRRATALLAAVLERWAGDARHHANLLPRSDSLPVLVDFFCARLGDHPSVSPCLRALRALLRVAEAHPDAHPTAATVVSRAVFSGLHVGALDQPTRFAVYELLASLLTSPVHCRVVGGSAGAPEAASVADFGAGLAGTMDGEKDPRCLLVCLRAAQAVLSPGPPLGWGALLPEAARAELFDVTSCYFPIAFTPPPNDPHGITREGLVASLRNVLTACPATAPQLVPLLLEKLTSSVPDAKRDAAQTIRCCVGSFGVGPLAPFLRDMATSLRSEAVFPGRGRGGGAAPVAQGGDGSGAEAGAVLLPAASRLWTAPVLEEVARSESPSESPGECTDAGCSEPHQHDTGRRRGAVGPSAAAIGLDFCCSDAGVHGRSGYGTFQPLTSDLPPTPSPVVEEVLTTIHAVAGALAAHVAATGSTAEWRDFVGLLLSDCLTEVERSVDSAPGRASGRVLAALASSSPYSLSAVVEATLPLVVPLLEEATVHHRYAVRWAALELLGGLVHCASAFVDYPPGHHPLSPHVSTLYGTFIDALSSVPATPASHGASDSSGSNVPGAMGGATAVDRGALLVAEGRCIAAAALADLCVRPPSPVLSPGQLQAAVSLLAAVATDDGSPPVRVAATRALCVVATVRVRGVEAVLAHAVPSLLEAVVSAVAEDEGGGSGSDGGDGVQPTGALSGAEGSARSGRALETLVQVACAPSLRLQRAIAPRLLALAIHDVHAAAAPSGPSSSSRAERCALVPGPLALRALTSLSDLVCLKAQAGDTAAVDDFVIPPARSEGDASESSEAAGGTQGSQGVLSSMVYLLVDAATASPPALLPPAALESVEAALRLAAITASGPVQDALREAVTHLLLHTHPHTDSSSAGAQAGPLVALTASADQLGPLTSVPFAAWPCVAPLLSVVACGRKGSPVPAPGQLVPALVGALFASEVESLEDRLASLPPVTSCELVQPLHGPSQKAQAQAPQQQRRGDPPACAVAVAIAQALGAVFNRLPDGPALNDLLAVTSASIVQLGGVGRRSLAPLMLRAVPSGTAGAGGLAIGGAPSSRASGTTTSAASGGATGPSDGSEAPLMFIRVPDDAEDLTTYTDAGSIGSSGGGSGGSSHSAKAVRQLVHRCRERGVLALVWVTKGLAQRGHPDASRLVSALVQAVLSGAGEMAGVRLVAPEQHLATLAGQGLGCVVSDARPTRPLSREAGAAVAGLYKQKMFSLVHAQYQAALRRDADVTAAAAAAAASSAGTFTPASGMLSAGSSGSTHDLVSTSTPAGTPFMHGGYGGLSTGVSPPVSQSGSTSSSLSSSSSEGVGRGVMSPAVLPPRETAEHPIQLPPLAFGGQPPPPAASGAAAGGGARSDGAGEAAPGSPVAAAGPTPHAPLLLSLCAMASHLPRPVLLGDVDRVLPLVIRALEVTAFTDAAAAPVTSASAAAAASPHAEPATAASAALSDLRYAVAISALQSLRLLVRHTPASVSVHVHTLVPTLLALARVRQHSRPALRASAIDVLRGFGGLPYHRLHPVRQQVMSGLVPVLDDPKRAVRRRAGACRNDWLTISAGTTGEVR